MKSKQWLSISSSVIYLLPAVFALLQSWYLASFAFTILAYATAYYHFYDEKISAGFDHVGILFTFISMMWIWKGSGAPMWYLFTFILMLILLAFLNEYIVLGVSFVMMYATYWDQVPILTAIGLLVAFALSYAVQFYAEKFKYRNPDKYDFWHSIWHLLSGLTLFGMLWEVAK